MVSVEDICFWLICTGAIFKLQFEQANGVSRGFAILGFLIGMVVYSWCIGKWLMYCTNRITRVLKRGLTKFGNFFKIVLCKQKKHMLGLGNRYGSKKGSDAKEETE